MPDVLKCDRQGPVAILFLNRPEKLNALSNELLVALTETLDWIELDRAVRSVIITGTGRAFSAGADIGAFQAHMRAGPQEAVAHFMRPGHRMTRRVESFSKPIIAAVNGLAFGGGCELVEATHIAIAAESATFSKAEINIGIIPTFGGTQRLPRNVGRKAATELILSGRVFDASEAVRLGLVNRVVAEGDLMRTALELASELASKPPLTLAAALTAIHRGMDAAIDEGLAIEEAAFIVIVQTDDAREGVAAFVEKRPPCSSVADEVRVWEISLQRQHTCGVWEDWIANERFWRIPCEVQRNADANSAGSASTQSDPCKMARSDSNFCSPDRNRSRMAS